MTSEYELITSQMPGKIHEYLGDAVFVSYDGYQLWLCTSNGLCVTNRVALEPGVYENLLKFVANNLLIDESRNLLAHLEKSTRGILESCKNNMAMHKANSENLEKFLGQIKEQEDG